jgi:transcriptional regulator with XRE-family HTH domain
MNGKAAANEAKRLAWKAGVSVSSLCAAAGVHRTAVWRWSRGDRMPEAETIDKLRRTAKRLAAKNPYATTR